MFSHNPIGLFPSSWSRGGWEMEWGWKKSQEGGHERLGYLVSCLKQYTQKRCPHWAWKGFLRTSLHFWHWYLGSMDTDRTRWGIPGKEESIEEGKEGRAITFHLPSMLIILKKNRNIQKKWINFTYNMNSSKLVNDWIALIKKKKLRRNFRKSQIMRIEVPSKMPNRRFLPQWWCYCKNSGGKSKVWWSCWKDVTSSNALDDLEVHKGTGFIGLVIQPLNLDLFWTLYSHLKQQAT